MFVDPALWVPWLFAAAVAVTTLVVMTRQLQRARIIEDMPTSRIRSAAQGCVELNGSTHLVDGESPLLAPLTQTPCLWYRYTIERFDTSRRGRRWQVVERGVSSASFLLDDGTGRCLVEPTGAEVTTMRRQQWRDEARRPLHRLLPVMVSGTYRYTEFRIDEGDWLYLLGELRTPRRPTFHEEAAAGQRQLLSTWKSDQVTLVARFDADGDGHISGDEWEQARAAAAVESAQAVWKREIVEPLPAISRPRTGGHPFLIASEDPRQLARRYRWRAVATLVLGSCLATGFASGLIV